MKIDFKLLQYSFKIKRKSPGMENFIILDHIRENNTIWSNSGCNLTDIGDGIVNLEWRTKMNSIGGEVLEGIQKSIEIAEKNYKGLVIANQGANFSVGANIAMIFMMAIEQEYEEIDFAVRAFPKYNWKNQIILLFLLWLLLME